MKTVKVILFFSLLPAVLFNINCGEEKKEELIRPVKYMEVYNTGGTRLARFKGSAELDSLTPLVFKVTGTVNQIAQSGDDVKKGELIAQLEQQEYENAMRDARTSFEDALEKYDELLSMQTFNEDSAAAENELLRAEQELNKTQIRFLQAEYMLNETKLYAPVEGVVKETFAEKGDVIEPGDTVAVIDTESAVRINVELPAFLTGGIDEGDEVTVKFPESTKETFPANIEFIKQDTGNYRQTVQVSVKLREQIEEIDSGDEAEVTFLFSQPDRSEGIVIPETAIIQKENENFVFVLKPIDGVLARAELKKVITAETKPEGVEVTEGLNEGDLIITAGVDRIKENQTVKLLSNGD